MKATWLFLSIVLWSSVSWSFPAPCYSVKYDASIASAVDQYWRDFREPKWWKAQLCQESRFNADAVSPVGAQGLAQIMPKTYDDIVKTLRWDSQFTAFNPDRAIQAGAYYQGTTRRFWSANGRSARERHELGLAGYNAGNGNILKAQRLCSDAVLWSAISGCLSLVTGQYAKETLTYVARISQYAADLIGDRR